MTLKNQDFAALIESQISVWQGQIKEHQERLSQAGAEGRANYEKAVAGMRENTEQTGKLLLKVRDANEGRRRVGAARRPTVRRLVESRP